ncbi:hypothetical protein E4T56_gene16364 [Termitomyces sp. T112]|nr:hypothetical protein E4T56_gene16364 [Termitomyces sp. T112]
MCPRANSIANSILTLVNSSATNNFINKSLAVLAPQYLQHLSTPILLKLSDGNPTSAGNITHFPFNVSPLYKGSKGTPGVLQTSSQLHSKSTQLFVINVWLDDSPTVLHTLVNSGASGIFVSNQLDLFHDILNKILKLQLFDRSPASTGITHYHNNALTLNNNLRFQVWLLVTQL